MGAEPGGESSLAPDRLSQGPQVAAAGPARCRVVPESPARGRPVLRHDPRPADPVLLRRGRRSCVAKGFYTYTGPIGALRRLRSQLRDARRVPPAGDRSTARDVGADLTPRVNTGYLRWAGSTSGASLTHRRRSDRTRRLPPASMGSTRVTRGSTSGNRTTSRRACSST